MIKILPARFRRSHQKLRSLARDLIARGIRRDYSQAGETIAVRQLLKKAGRSGARSKTFVEIGANDGVTVSTTLGLVKDGWTGWSVEANPSIFEKLKLNLKGFPRVKPVNIAVAPLAGTVKLYLGKEDPLGLLSTLSNDDSPWFREHRSETFVEVDGIPLSALMREQGVPVRFELLLIDTEGMDFEILQTLDPQEHRPYLIITEDYEPKNEIKFELLRSYGYKFERRLGCNTFWTDTTAAPSR